MQPNADPQATQQAAPLAADPRSDATASATESRSADPLADPRVDPWLSGVPWRQGRTPDPLLVPDPPAERADGWHGSKNPPTADPQPDPSDTNPLAADPRADPTADLTADPPAKRRPRRRGVQAFGQRICAPEVCATCRCFGTANCWMHKPIEDVLAALRGAADDDDDDVDDA